jgi:oligopeptide/dipeptide ABC transporter ATP-binding protein
VPTLTETRHRLYQIQGTVPPPGTIRQGCPFRPRCPLAMDRCAVEMPPLVAHGPTHRAACWATAPEATA